MDRSKNLKSRSEELEDRNRDPGDRNISRCRKRETDINLSKFVNYPLHEHSEHEKSPLK